MEEIKIRLKAGCKNYLFYKIEFDGPKDLYESGDLRADFLFDRFEYGFKQNDGNFVTEYSRKFDPNGSFRLQLEDFVNWVHDEISKNKMVGVE